jgi:CheY-like chemotaxis protein
VTVRDTGVGIAPDMLPRVFDLFTQVERESVRAQGGLGIGLALVRQLVGMHGGKVEAHSDGPGKGSEFVLQLPLTNRAAEASEGSAATKWRAGPAGTRVLVVDDNIDSAVTLATLLEILGYQTATAHDGGEAVRQAESFAPHVAVLDLGLPVMSGYDAARRIRSSAWGQDMLLVALSGWGQAVDRRKSAEAGFDHHFVKPVDLDALTQVLATVRSPGGGE